MTEDEARQALARIDAAVASLNLPRQQHAQLARDVQAIQARVEFSFGIDKSKRSQQECPSQPAD